MDTLSNKNTEKFIPDTMAEIDSLYDPRVKDNLFVLLAQRRVAPGDKFATRLAMQDFNNYVQLRNTILRSQALLFREEIDTGTTATFGNRYEHPPENSYRHKAANTKRVITDNVDLAAKTRKTLTIARNTISPRPIIDPKDIPQIERNAKHSEDIANDGKNTLKSTMKSFLADRLTEIKSKNQPIAPDNLSKDYLALLSDYFKFFYADDEAWVLQAEGSTANIRNRKLQDAISIAVANILTSADEEFAQDDLTEAVTLITDDIFFNLIRTIEQIEE